MHWCVQHSIAVCKQHPSPSSIVSTSQLNFFHLKMVHRKICWCWCWCWWRVKMRMRMSIKSDKKFCLFPTRVRVPRKNPQRNLNKRVKSGYDLTNSLKACVFKLSCSHLCCQIQSTHTCRHFLIENASTEKD